MTIARAEMIDASLTRWYHCVSYCVRGASLHSEGGVDRKQWLESRIEELAGIFSVSIAAYAILDDRFHVLARLDPDVAKRWSDNDVVRRWGRLSPPRDKLRQVLEVSDEWVKGRLKERRWAAGARERLQSLGWFMKSLKEPLSRLANREDETRGPMFQGRFKSVAILDEESLAASCICIDLAALSAGTAQTPSTGQHTSIQQRLRHVKAQRRVRNLKGALRGLAAGSAAAAGLEDGCWLCPIEDRRGLDSAREGLLEGLSLGSYVLLLDDSGRLIHDPQAVCSPAVAEILGRLGCTPESWQARLARLSRGRLMGRYLAASRARLREVAEQLGVSHLANLDGCPTR